MKSALTALGLALFLGAVLIAVAQKSFTAPWESYRALFVGALGSPLAIGATLARATPLLLTGLAVAVALRAGLFNIGGQGQMTVGALAAACVGFALPAPAWVLLPLCLLAGMLGGALWAWLPVFLKETRGAHEVITAILLNYGASRLTRYLASGPLKAPGETPQTPEVGALLPRLHPDFDVHAGLFISLLALVALAWTLTKTVWGYELRAVGAGADAARVAGIEPGRVRRNAFLLSGALAGLAGAVVVCGETPFRRFPADFSTLSYGFDGLAVAMLAGSGSLFLVAPAALLFGGLGAGAEAMAFAVNTPKQLVLILEAILIAALTVRISPLPRAARGRKQAEERGERFGGQP